MESTGVLVGEAIPIPCQLLVFLFPGGSVAEMNEHWIICWAFVPKSSDCILFFEIERSDSRHTGRCGNQDHDLNVHECV